eukprot:gnl/Trimastix_PCT/2084.p1 GENE.gnl/Trimastix_PCT/2084~~gnl/Trimastix_PCT/2084.p1  ORF type:complete len:298 (-),score=107.46 gnl/Trimastix_PCT/2084:215-1108(-)
MSQNIRLGWVGTGVMGFSMCKHLIQAGYPMTVYTRTIEKALPLRDLGATIVDSPKEVGENADIIFFIVGFPHDVREVILGEQGVLGGCKEGAIIVDCTTSEPSLAEEMARRGAEKGVAVFDAPVSGGDVGARNATLSIMLGGPEDKLPVIMPMLEVIGKTITYCGAAGKGQHTKMVNQILIATGLIGVCEGLLYGYKAGLDMDAVIAAVGGGAAGSWSLSNYGPRILQRNFDPGFFVEHFVKDMEIALDEARRMNLSLPGLALAHQLYVALKAQGSGKKGNHALMLALEHLNHVTRE